MRRTFRTTTALVASLSIAASHLPLAAMAQDFDASQCVAGENPESCLARLIEEGAVAAPGAPVQDPEAEAARQAEEAAAAEAARLAEEAAAAEAARQAEEAAAEAARQAEETAAEAARQAEEAAAVEAARLAEEAAAAEAARQAEAAAAAEAARQAEEAAAVEAARQAEEAAAVEAARQAEEAAAAEAARLAEEATDAEAAEARLAEALAAAEAARLAEEAAAAAAAALAAQEVTPGAAPVEETLAEDPAPVVPEATVPQATAEAPVSETAPLSEADALAAALAAAAVAAGLGPDAISPEDQAELAAAQEAAAAAELSVADPVDPIAEVEAQIAAEAEASEDALQSLALMPGAAPSSEVVTEVITEETARQSDEDFGAIVTSEPAAPANTAAAEDSRDRGRIEGAILGGIAGLVVGSILSGNRQVVNRADDRVVVLRPQGDYQVIRDDDALMRRPGNAVVTESFADGSSRNIITQPDGTQVITVRGPDLQILRRTVVAPDGTRTVLIDDTRRFDPVQVSQLPQIRPGAGLAAVGTSSDQAALARALAAQGASDRGFSLAQVRGIRAVRDLAPAVNLENVTFATGSAAITPDQAAQLLSLGRFMADVIARNPGEIFLLEGHTDATGGAAMNLALSDRRAETVALALTEFFGVPPQNMVIQGYGEEFLLIPTLDNERLNRRVAVRRITDLLRVAAAN